MKITRRKLAAVLVASAAASTAATAAQAQPAGDPLATAKARVKSNSEALAKEAVPMTAEPAFQFRA